jgi:hypothetical protein
MHRAMRTISVKPLCTVLESEQTWKSQKLKQNIKYHRILICAKIHKKNKTNKSSNLNVKYINLNIFTSN